ncbi:MAG: HEAT repeat domain-containing protein [Planctomycetes bacterium]|nr:HEAT repeat domain-containing protein [Planctomycetota bacterium]
MRKTIIIVLSAILLAGCTGTGPEEHRRQAIMVLGNSPESANLLVKALKEDTDDLCRAQAVLGLGDIKAVEYVPDIIAAFEDKSPVVREDCAYTLGRLGDVTANNALIKHLSEDPDLAVRCRSAQALGMLKCLEAVPVLVGYLEHKDSRLKLSSYSALKVITGLEIELDKSLWHARFPESKTAPKDSEIPDLPMDELRALAEEGNPVAQANLGVRYFYGEDIDVDYAEALKWFQKSADQDNYMGQNGLANCYRLGAGVNKDEARAFELFLDSAQQGYPSAQYNLSVCYMVGTGVKPDKQKALEWMQKAADQGMPEAIDALKLMKK